jgi:hypothetical protein
MAQDSLCSGPDPLEPCHARSFAVIQMILRITSDTMRTECFSHRFLRFSYGASVIVACGLCLSFLASRAFAASPVGLWYAEGGAAEVQIFQCADALCGKVVWLRSPLGDDGCELRDDKNPDATLRARAIVGLLALTGLKAGRR